MADSPHEAVVRRYIEQGFARGDEAVLESVISDVMVSHATRRNATLGKGGIIRGVRSLRTKFVNLQIVLRDLWTEHGLVKSRTTVSGIAILPFRGQPPSGKPTHFEIQATFRVVGDRIVERWDD